MAYCKGTKPNLPAQHGLLCMYAFFAGFIATTEQQQQPAAAAMTHERDGTLHGVLSHHHEGLRRS